MVERAQLDPQHFSELYDRYVNQIYRFVYLRVRDQTVAEDVTADVFLRALSNIGRYRHAGHPFSAWLYQIASNAITDRHRTAQRHGVPEDINAIPYLASSDPLPEDEVSRKDDLERLWARIDRLPEQQRRALTLKFQEDLKISQIAHLMGKSPGAVKLLIHRGMRHLRADIATGSGSPRRRAHLDSDRD